MADKKNAKSKSTSRGVVGFLKKLAARDVKPRPSAPSKRAKASRAPQTKAAAKVAKKAKPNGKAAVVPAQAPPVKKKPPSITITRPEVTRPPVVLPPPRPLEAPVGAPSILVPKGGLPISSLTPNLRWMYVGGATRYEVEWSPDPHFGRGKSASLIAAQTAITLDAAHELKPATMYKWRVRGGNDAGWGPWSMPESFRSPEK